MMENDEDWDPFCDPTDAVSKMDSAVVSQVQEANVETEGGPEVPGDVIYEWWDPYQLAPEVSGPCDDTHTSEQRATATTVAPVFAPSQAAAERLAQLKANPAVMAFCTRIDHQYKEERFNFNDRDKPAELQDAELSNQMADMEVRAEIERRCRAETMEEEEFKEGMRGSLFEVKFYDPERPGTVITANVVTAANQASSYILNRIFKKKKKQKTDDSPVLRLQSFRCWAIMKFFASVINYRFERNVSPFLQQFMNWLSEPEGLFDVLYEYKAAVNEPEPTEIKGVDSKMDMVLSGILATFTSMLSFLVGAGTQELRTHFTAAVRFLESLLFSDGDQTEDQSWFSDVPFPSGSGCFILRTTLESATKMLVELKAEYSDPEFHAEYIQRRNSITSVGDSHVEFVLTVQSKVITRYGFEGSLQGVREMRNNAEFFLISGDPIISKLTTDIHDLLSAYRPQPKPREWLFEVGWRPELAVAPPGEAAAVVQSVRDSDDRLAVKENLAFVDDFSFSGPIVNVDLCCADQEVVGFGGAFTEASSLVFKGLTKKLQQEVLELYFGSDGIGYNAGRLHINSCDFSEGNYSFDDVVDDFALKHFDSNVTHDTEAIIPFVLAAKRKVTDAGGELRLLASPWSPPAWMKTNGQMNHSHSPGLRADCQASWAHYFARWISAYNTHGLHIWAVTVQNEPEHKAHWEACHYTAEQQADFIGKHLGPTLQASHPEVGIFAFDHNKDHVRNWARVIYQHKEAAKYVRGIAFHWYTGDGFDDVRRTHRDWPKAVLLPTEACYERHRFNEKLSAQGHWNFGEGYAHDILGDLNSGAAGWIDWNLLLDSRGGPNHVGNFCDAPIITSSSVGTGGELRIHPQYFFIGHFSKYILAGSRRLVTSVSGVPFYEGRSRPYGTCTAEDGIEATAFLRPDGVVAVVILNCTEQSMRFKLQVGQRALRARIPSHAIQTYLFCCSAQFSKS